MGYGLDDPEQEAVPALIQQRIDAENSPFCTVNAGLSGDTSAGGLKTLDNRISQPVDVFVLEPGTRRQR